MRKFVQVNSVGRMPLIAATILFVLSSRASAAWVGNEGEMWLKWDMSTRNAYVYAYVKGITRGFMQGCSAGVDYLSAMRKYTPGEAESTLNGCASLSPIKLARIDDRAMIQSITQFYKIYPQQRVVYISDLLQKLLAGEAIQQVHNEFPKGS